MAEITFNRAQKALGHLNKKRHPNGMQETPDLLKVKGWEKSKKVYQLKTDIEKSFQTEIDRFRDLSEEGNKLETERQEIKKKGELSKQDKERLGEIADRITEINEEVSDIFKEEKEVRLSHKLTEKEFGSHITGETFIDLDFAIEMNNESSKEDKKEKED